MWASLREVLSAPLWFLSNSLCLVDVFSPIWISSDCKCVLWHCSQVLSASPSHEENNVEKECFLNAVWSKLCCHVVLKVFFQLGHVFFTDWSFWIHISITIFLSYFEDSLEQLIAPDEMRVADYVKASGFFEVSVDSSSDALETWILVALVRRDLQSREVLQDGLQFICVHRVNVWEPFQL